MDIENFVQTIKSFCNAKGIKPTVACRESGVGQSFINNMEARGSVPSVEKVQMLAQYLDVTVSELLGEVDPGDSMDKNLGWDDRWVLERYHRLSAQQKEVVDNILDTFGKKETNDQTG